MDTIMFVALTSSLIRYEQVTQWPSLMAYLVPYLRHP